MTLIESSWKTYRDNVLPKDAEPKHVQSTCLAYYGSAVTITNAILLAIKEDKLQVVLDSICAELLEFRDAVQEMKDRC